MKSYDTRTELLELVRTSLQGIGYRADLLRHDYRFADFLADATPTRRIDLAAFAQEPPSYRNACFGVVTLEQQGPEAIQPFQALGAPQILALYPERAEVYRWKMLAQGQPMFIERIDATLLPNVFEQRRDEWKPERVLRAKSIGFTRGATQLDFFDIGLLPALESVVHRKLDELLRDVLAISRHIYTEHHEREPDYEALFRLIFRFVAAKMLADRQFPGGDWASSDPQRVITAVEQFYFQHAPGEQVLNDAAVQRAAWDKIRGAFLFQNLSVEALAYVYENTMVSPQTRRQLDTHATPPEVAEYIVQHLPFEVLAEEERRIFEPFAGHAPFLIASLGRLRNLLPASLSSKERHDYFVRMLTGMEIDAFAREVAHYSLILADYPNPNGWQIALDNAFSSPKFSTYLEHANIVLCNPPYGNFTPNERQLTSKSPNKAVEALRRVLQRPPRMLGFVLPRVFVAGQLYREVRGQLAKIYQEIETIVLPDTVFQYSDVEVALVIASTNRNTQFRRSATFVSKNDYHLFTQLDRPSWRVNIPVRTAQDSEPVFWIHPLESIWRALALTLKLGDVAEIHRGIEYNVPLQQHLSQLIIDKPRPGFLTGLVNVQDGFEPYASIVTKYLNVDPSVMRSGAYTLPWEQPKVIANAARLSRGPWTLAAVVDQQGLVCYQNFHGIWPTKNIPLELIAAVLNGPVANAFIDTHVTKNKRHNQVGVIKQIPFPTFTAAQTQSLVSLVTQYRDARTQWRNEPERGEELAAVCLELMRQIDAEVLAAYNLPPRLERELLDYFAGEQRPSPVRFDRYYPADFKPSIPWRIYISRDFQQSSARATITRLPVINDPVISAAISDLDE